MNLGLNQENKAACLTLAVEGYATYALLVANIINAVRHVLQLSPTNTTVFATASQLPQVYCCYKGDSLVDGLLLTISYTRELSLWLPSSQGL